MPQRGRLLHLDGVAHSVDHAPKLRIAAERVARHKVALPIEARASALVRTLIANGSTRARSHVDIDNDVGLANLESVLKVREVYRDWIDIQLVAFPQSGVMTEDGAPDLLAAAPDLPGADEDRTLSRLRGLRSDLIDPAIDVHHGRIVKRTGDGSLIEFRSVVDAA